MYQRQVIFVFWTIYQFFMWMAMFIVGMVIYCTIHELWNWRGEYL